MITKIEPNQQQSQALRKMAMITLERLRSTAREKYPSNTLIDYYDAIHKLLEAQSISQGIKIKGEGAHQELIDHICKTCNLEEQNRVFLQQMRDYRNRISYEGFMVSTNYIQNFEQKIIDIINILERLTDQTK